MVHVLPVPVCPYAKTVQFNPSVASSTRLAIDSAYKSRCEISGPNTASKAYVFVDPEIKDCLLVLVLPVVLVSRLVSIVGSMLIVISLDDEFVVTAFAACDARSVSFAGLQFMELKRDLK